MFDHPTQTQLTNLTRLVTYFHVFDQKIRPTALDQRHKPTGKAIAPDPMPDV